MSKSVDGIKRKSEDIPKKDSKVKKISRGSIFKFFKKDKAGWSFSKHHKKLAENLNKEHKNLTVSPASKELIKEAKKIKKAEAKKTRKSSKLLQPILFVTRVLSLSLLVSLVIFLTGIFAYQSQYRDRAFLGTQILGEDVGGKNHNEIRAIVQEKTKSITFSFEVDGEEIEARPDEAGIYFKIKETTQNALSKGKSRSWHENYLWAGGSLISYVSPKTFSASVGDTTNIDLEYSINEEALSGFIKNLSLKFDEDSQNAGLVMMGTEVQVIPAVFGRKIVFDSVREQIVNSVKNARSKKISIQVEKVNPAILEDDTRETIEEAKSLLNIPVDFKYEDKTYSPDKATIGSWIIFENQKSEGSERLVPKFDPKRVYSYIYGLSAKINVPAINKKVTVKNGAETVVEREGKEGLSVDVDKAAYETASILNQRKPVSLLLPTYVVRPKTQVNNIVVADWNKYIVIDLSDQKMCAYLAGGEVVNCWSVTTGATNRGWGTPVGTYLIWSKRYRTDMPNPPYSEPLRNVHYVSYFTYQYHAIHEAWWRSVFGGADYPWNGSHGCVNAPKSVAQFIYNWAPIGTPVIVQN